MNAIDEKLYKYLGDKTLSFGCLYMDYDLPNGTKRYWIVIDFPPVEYGGNPDVLVFDYSEKKTRWLDAIDDRDLFICHEPTLTDFHRLLNSNELLIWEQDNAEIRVDMGEDGLYKNYIPYDSSKSLLNQSIETKEAINKLIEEYGNN